MYADVERIGMYRDLSVPVGVANGLLGRVSSVGVAKRGRRAFVLLGRGSVVCGGDPEASWRLLEG